VSDQTLIEKLGFSPTDKVVIFHMDDVGFSHAANVASFECLDFGVATCGSVIVPSPWTRNSRSSGTGSRLFASTIDPVRRLLGIPRALFNSIWNSFRPLGISCAATLTSDGFLRKWYGADDGRRLPDKMTPKEISKLVSYLRDMDEASYPTIGWNSLGFDFKILADECTNSDVEICKQLALDHVDPMFHFFCENGYTLGLDKACRGMGLMGKTEGMHGGKAPEMWAKERANQDLVLEYCAQDVRATAELLEAIVKHKRINWTSNAGNPCSWQVDELLPVHQAMKLPEPDTSWMSNPWKRSKFYGWLKAGV